MLFRGLCVRICWSLTVFNIHILAPGFVCLFLIFPEASVFKFQSLMLGKRGVICCCSSCCPVRKVMDKREQDRKMLVIKTKTSAWLCRTHSPKPNCQDFIVRLNCSTQVNLSDTGQLLKSFLCAGVSHLSNFTIFSLEDMRMLLNQQPWAGKNILKISTF